MWKKNINIVEIVGKNKTKKKQKSFEIKPLPSHCYMRNFSKAFTYLLLDYYQIVWCIWHIFGIEIQQLVKCLPNTCTHNVLTFEIIRLTFKMQTLKKIIQWSKLYFEWIITAVERGVGGGVC